MQKTRIGLVDDHPFFLEGIINWLNKYNNYEVVYSETCAKKVLSYHKKNSNILDLLITDISMPEMTGIDLIKKVKKISPNIKTIVLSTYPSIKSNPLIDAHVTKDCNLDELKETIEKVILGENIYNKRNNNFKFSNNIVSKREKEIIKLISIGLTSDQISEKLFISTYTVDTHKKNIFRKLGIHTNAELVKKGVYLGIIK